MRLLLLLPFLPPAVGCTARLRIARHGTRAPTPLQPEGTRAPTEMVLWRPEGPEAPLPKAIEAWLFWRSRDQAPSEEATGWKPIPFHGFDFSSRENFRRHFDGNFLRIFNGESQRMLLSDAYIKDAFLSFEGSLEINDFFCRPKFMMHRGLCYYLFEDAHDEKWLVPWSRHQATCDDVARSVGMRIGDLQAVTRTNSTVIHWIEQELLE